MQSHPGFARLLPLASLTGLGAGTFALLASARPVQAPVPAPPVVTLCGPAVFDDGCSALPVPVPAHGIVDADGRRWELAEIPTQFIAGVDLRNAEWFGVDLHGAHLLACDFRGADLRGADLRGVELWDCDFTGADLTDADLAGATYSGNIWWPAGFDPKAHGATPPVWMR